MARTQVGVGTNRLRKDAISGLINGPRAVLTSHAGPRIVVRGKDVAQALRKAVALVEEIRPTTPTQIL